MMPSLTYTKMIKKYSWSEIEGRCDCGKPFVIQDPDDIRSIPVKILGQWHLDAALELEKEFHKLNKPAEIFVETILERRNKRLFELSKIQLVYRLHLGFAYSLLGIPEVNEELKKHRPPEAVKSK